MRGKFEILPRCALRLTVASVAVVLGCGCSSGGTSGENATGGSGAGGGPGGGGAAGAPESWTPTLIEDGLPDLVDGIYTDLGIVPPGDEIRALIGLPVRSYAQLQATIKSIYSPDQPGFRQYLSQADYLAQHAPLQADVDLVVTWLEQQGFSVPRIAENRLLISFTGMVDDFNLAFETKLHLFERNNWQDPGEPHLVYGTLGPLHAPFAIAKRITGVVTCDQPASTDPLPSEVGAIDIDGPFPETNPGWGLSLGKVARAYSLDDLYAAGYTGQNVTIGVVVGAMFKFIDVQSLWQSFGVVRDSPVVVQTMEPPATRYLETTLDVQWSGGLAPDSTVIVYAGPDNMQTSLLYTFNEAVGQAAVDVITDSFAHREDAEAKLVSESYHQSAAMAAALGISVVSASGNSAGTDVPSNSAYITAVGGTQLTFGPSGNVVSEVAWDQSGCGESLHFEIPWYQLGVVGSSGARGMADVALNAAPTYGSAYWTYYLHEWILTGGTSFATPVFSAVLAVVNSYRLQNGLPKLGLLNPILYTDPATQSAFHDITSGGTAAYQAAAGWDYPSGWGSPDAYQLALTLP